ncbi:malate transporter, partial [Escherichia coli]|nr:malate transporter [Escherichia coli]
MDNFIKVITTQGMWGAVISTIVFVAIGFAATRAKIVTKEMNGRMSKLVLNFFLPFMVLTAFMQDASKEDAAAVGIV